MSHQNLAILEPWPHRQGDGGTGGLGDADSAYVAQAASKVNIWDFNGKMEVLIGKP